ncbi:alpha/beta fold hydrolase [Desulfobacter vibrioformis]|uniref:alpha/beta fold hydrolase n=1 Tax=Desulfobacter vibrioformis TaxID=34031 RepID=UPI00054F1763|nr:alpha/beta fold hydrolase [Desulfobacter vibrioformis]
MVTRIINGQMTSTRGFENLYPFESHYARINGNQMHYVDQGKGAPVLMVHGNPTWSFYFRHLITGLSHGFRTIALDHIGCGFSDKPSAKDYDYTLDQRVADLDALIRRLDINEKMSLIVHDWGGMIGLAWALDNLDRVDKIVITNTSGFLLPASKRFPAALWAVKYLAPFAVPAVLGANIFARGALYLAPKTRLPQSVKKGLVAPYNSWANRIATLKFVQDIPVTAKDRSYVRVQKVDQNLSALDPAQLMFLWGTRDFVFDIHFLEEFKNRFPRTPAHVFEDAGHYLFEDKPGPTLELIQKFLS